MDSERGSEAFLCIPMRYPYPIPSNASQPSINTLVTNTPERHPAMSKILSFKQWQIQQGKYQPSEEPKIRTDEAQHRHNVLVSQMMELIAQPNQEESASVRLIEQMASGRLMQKSPVL